MDKKNDRQMHRSGPLNGHGWLLGAVGQLKSSNPLNCTALGLNAGFIHLNMVLLFSLFPPWEMTVMLSIHTVLVYTEHLDQCLTKRGTY